VVEPPAPKKKSYDSKNPGILLFYRPMLLKPLQALVMGSENKNKLLDLSKGTSTYMYVLHELNTSSYVVI
jgi:hypothetical protein